MSFELYVHKGEKGRFSYPTVTIQASGGLGINDVGYEAIGAPKHVNLLYDRESRRIGIKATESDDENGFQIRKSGESSYTVSARSFYSYFGIDSSRTARFKADVEGSVLVATLEAPVSTRKSRKRQASELGDNGAVP